MGYVAHMGSPALSELLLISPPMLWLDEIVAHEPRSVRCRFTPREDHPFVEDGHVEPLIALEWMTQAAALLAALEARDQGRAPVARRLSGAEEASFDSEPIAVDSELSIVARLENDASFRCEVTRDGALIAAAHLRLSEVSG